MENNQSPKGLQFTRRFTKEGTDVFDQFEQIAMPAIHKYNGRLLLRVRPADDAYIENHIGKPYEIHLVEFASEADFENFSKDEERKKFLHLKEQSIESFILYKGVRL